MPRRRSAHSQADIDRALKAAQKAGAREVTIEKEGVKLSFVLTVDSVEKSKAKVARQFRTMI